MEGDRELLELAAKAAGISGEYYESDNDIHTGIFQHDAMRYWNPLADDGDALRLAVKLGMHCVEAFPVVSMKEIEDAGGDEYAAVRRAIVRRASQ